MSADQEKANENNAGKGGMPAPKDKKEKKRLAVLLMAAVLLVLLLAAGAVISLRSRGEKETGIIGTWVPEKTVSGTEGVPAGAEGSGSVSAEGMDGESPAAYVKDAADEYCSVSADGAEDNASAAQVKTAAEETAFLWDHADERMLSLKKDGTYVLSSPAGTGETVHSGTWSFSGTELTLRRRVADGTLTAADLGSPEQSIAILPDENGTFLMTGGGRELSGGYQMIGADGRDVTAPLLLKGAADESGAARFTWGDTEGTCRISDGSLILYPDDAPAAYFLRLDKNEENERVFTLMADGTFTLTEGGDKASSRGTWQAVQDGWCFTFEDETDDKAEGKTEQQSEEKEAKNLTVTLSENGGYTDSAGRTGLWEAEDRTIVMMLQNVTVTGVFGCTLQEDTLLLRPLSLPDEGMGTPAEPSEPWVYRRK